MPNFNSQDKPSQPLQKSSQPNQIPAFDSRPSPLPPEKKSYKRLIIVLITVLLLLGIAGAGVWYILTQNREEAANVQQQHKQKQDDKVYGPFTNNAELRQSEMMFAKVDSATQSTEIFRRPKGEDRSEKVIGVGGIYTEGHYTSYENNMAFSVDGKLYASKDGGTSFKEIYSAPDGEDITSVKFSKKQPFIAVAVTNVYSPVLQDTSYKNKIISMNVDGNTQKQLFTEQDVGVYIRDWSLDKGKVVYQSGCGRCDQAPRYAKVYDTKAGKLATEIKQDGLAMSNLSLNETGNLVFYTLALHDPRLKLYGNLNQEYYGPPYSFHRLHIASGEDKSFMTVGEKIANPRVPSDIPAPPIMSVAGTENGRQHYYFYDGKVRVLYDTTTTEELLKIGDKVKDILLVNQSQIIAVIGDDKQWRLISFDVKNGNQQTLFTTEGSTIPLGISDQN